MLTLTMLRCPDMVLPEMRTAAGGEFSIGRGAENHWVLSDPERFLSKRHCLLAYRSGCWQVADLSTNGTFLNGELEPLGRGHPRDLRDGDRLRLGGYEIELRIAETAMPRPVSAGRSNRFALDPFAAPVHPSPDSLAQDPLLRAAPENNPFAPALVPRRSIYRRSTIRSHRNPAMRPSAERLSPITRRISKTPSPRPCCV
jgi:type VI secretion system protein ImpI